MHLEINNSTLVHCTPCLFDLILNCFSNLFGCEKKGGAENERKEMWAILLRVFYFIILWMNVLVNVFFIASMCRLERQKKKKKKDTLWTPTWRGGCTISSVKGGWKWGGKWKKRNVSNFI